MLGILERRWTETLACQRVGADLAATVMLGGLLEALFLARINRLTNLAPVFTAAAAPKDKSSKPRPLKEWGLKDLPRRRQGARLDSSIGEGRRASAARLPKLHPPRKSYPHGITVVAEVTAMFITVFSSIADQIIKSV